MIGGHRLFRSCTGGYVKVALFQDTTEELPAKQVILDNQYFHAGLLRAGFEADLMI
jgi:hypothetical protein